LGQIRKRKKGKGIIGRAKARLRNLSKPDTCADSFKKTTIVQTIRPNILKSHKKEIKGMGIMIPNKVMKKGNQNN